MTVFWLKKCDIFTLFYNLIVNLLIRLLFQDFDNYLTPSQHHWQTTFWPQS